MKGSINILIVNDYGHMRGGGDRVAISSAIALAQAGHRVLFFCAVGPVDRELAGQPGVRVECLGIPEILADPSRWRAARNGAWNFGAAAAAARLLKGLDPHRSVVHVHSYTKAFSAAVPCMAADMGFRTILSLHDYFLMCPNGAFFEYPKMSLCGRAPLGGRCLRCRCDSRNHAHKLWRFARTWWQNRVARLPEKLSCVIAVSHTNLDTARASLPAATRIKLVPYPVDADPCEATAVEDNDGFLFVGRMELYKGPQLMAEAARRLGVRAVFCGDGPAADRVRELNPAAHMAGWLDRTELPKQIGRARALVFPSLWPETFGLSAAEALSRGVPVIVSRGTAAADLVEHGANGLVFDRGSVDSLSDMMGLMRDPVLARRLGREAHRRYWRAPFTMARHVSRLEEIYTDLVGGEVRAA